LQELVASKKLPTPALPSGREFYTVPLGGFGAPSALGKGLGDRSFIKESFEIDGYIPARIVHRGGFDTRPYICQAISLKNLLLLIIEIHVMEEHDGRVSRVEFEALQVADGDPDILTVIDEQRSGIIQQNLLGIHKHRF
jgi:hypothetical protein